MNLQEKLDERQNERMENEALKNAKEIAKRKSKDTVKTIVMHAVKAAAIPMFLLLLKVIAIVLAISAMISLFNIVVNGDTVESNGEGFNSASTQYSGADITTKIRELTEEQIIDFIENYENDNDELKESLKNNASEIKEWQDNYGYRADVFITIAFEEGITDFDSFLTEMNTKGQEWKDAGYKTITEIAQDYVGDETSEEWANNIIDKMHKTSIDAGIITVGEEQSITGDGYDDTFVSKTGVEYRNYKQNKGTYSTKNWCGSSIIKDDGCSLIAVTIVVSGFRGKEVDPLELAEKYAVINGGMYIDKALTEEGISYTTPFGIEKEYTDNQKQTIKNHVETGEPAIIKVEKPSPFTTSTHFMTLLDYNPESNQFYLSNPYTGNNSYGKTGWVDADYVLQHCTRFYAITI